MDWCEEGKLGTLPPHAITKGSSCLGIARDQASLFFDWKQTEGIPYRSCQREEDDIKRPTWLSEKVSPAGFHEGYVRQSTKLFTHDFWMHEKDVHTDVKKPHESAKMEDTAQKFPNAGNAVCLHDFDLLCECDRYVHHLMHDHQHDSCRFVFAVLPGNPPVFYNITWRRAADQRVGRLPTRSLGSTLVGPHELD